ncbi:MAG: hypothetical protein ABIJ24_05105 [Nitrospinota bacterium]|nr:hypothetical protein [Nitrospinota bacterium]
MKIDPKDIKVAALAGKITPSQKKEAGKDSFDALLSEVISRKGISADKAAPLSDMPDIVSTTSAPQDPFFNTASVDKLERIFNMMDVYQNALNNEQIGIQHFEGSLEELIAMSRKAIELMAYLPPEDGLGEIISESAATLITDSRLYHSLKRSN